MRFAQLLGDDGGELVERGDEGLGAIATLITDGGDYGSTRATAKEVRALVADMVAQENHVVAAMGISDGTMTELLLGPNAADAAELKVDAVVIIGTVGGAPAAGAQRPSGPRMPF